LKEINFIKQYGSIVKSCPKRHHKNHPKDILHDDNHLYRMILVHLTSNILFKQESAF